MGGDGGTLNNSRHEHTRLRQSVTDSRGGAEHVTQRQRASTTHCALSQVPLRPPHIVVDRLGQLYDKEALLRHLIRRKASVSSSQGVTTDPVRHIHSVRKDTATVRFAANPTPSPSTPFICPITKRTVAPSGHFSVSWECGCVFYNRAEDHPQRIVSSTVLPECAARLSADHARPCVVCTVVGTPIRLGLTSHERSVMQHHLFLRQPRRVTRPSKAGSTSGVMPCTFKPVPRKHTSESSAIPSSLLSNLKKH